MHSAAESLRLEMHPIARFMQSTVKVAGLKISAMQDVTTACSMHSKSASKARRNFARGFPCGHNFRTSLAAFAQPFDAGGPPPLF